jgi:NADPH:quinone reductase-like Zn-dependent oxidoreductase
MRVVEIHETFGIDSLRVAERSVPEPGPGEVLLQMRAWSLNYRDLLVSKGLYNPKAHLPLVPLSDGVGVVARTGEGVGRVKSGDRVAGAFMPGWVEGPPTEAKAKTALGGGGPGMLAEYVVLPEAGVVPVPAHFSDEEAATLPCAAVTAWHALVTEGDVQPGHTVLVQGTGGVSIFALQFARLAGARVLATTGTEAKVARLKELGASAVVNYRTVPQWGDWAREQTVDGVDHVVEVGGAGTLPQSLRAVRMAGRVSLIGVLAGPGDVNPRPILMKSVRVQGIFVGSRVMFEAMNQAIDLHRLRPVVDRVFDFREVREAMRYMESGAHTGKVCIRL